MPSRSGARSPVRMAGLAGALVAAAVLLLVVAQLPEVRREISRSTSREPARFTELYFTDRMWPEIGTADLAAAVQAFHARERRFGALPAAAAS